MIALIRFKVKRQLDSTPAYHSKWLTKRLSVSTSGTLVWTSNSGDSGYDLRLTMFLSQCFHDTTNGIIPKFRLPSCSPSNLPTEQNDGQPLILK